MNELKIIVIISAILVSPFFINEAFAETTSFIVGTVKQFQTDTSISSTCPTGTGTSSAVPKVEYGASGNNVGCKGLTFQFDVSSIPNTTVITDMTLRIDILGSNIPKNSQIFQITKDPSLMTDQEGTDAVFQRGGFFDTIYISNNTFSITSGIDKLIVLPNTAHADLRNQLLQGESEFWLAINYEDLVNRAVGDSSITYGGVDLQVTFDTTSPVISTTVPQPIPFTTTDTNFQKILKNVTADLGNVSVNDQTGFNDEMKIDTLDANEDLPIPTGSKIHAITLYNRGFADAETSLGLYVANNLISDLGIQHVDLDNSGNQTVTWFANPPVTKDFGVLRAGWISECTTSLGCTLTQWLGFAGLEIDIDSGQTFPNLPSTITKDSDSTLNIGHTITYQEPANIGSFDEFDFVTCIDNADGDITRSMTTVGSVDTSTPQGYTITYTCTDRASNQSQLEVQYIIKRLPTSGISVSTTQQPVGGVQEVPSLSDIPPISIIPIEPTEPPTRTLDEVFDLFSFLFEEVEPIPTLEVVPEPESITEIPPPLSQPPTPTEVRPSFIESIQNFFARLFG